MLETLVRLDIQYHVVIQWRPVKIVKIEKISRWFSPLKGDFMKEYPYNCRYLVHYEGKVYDTLKERFCPTYESHYGYTVISVVMDNTPKIKRVHRMVAETYHVDSEFYGLDVNHKDGNKANNHGDNLEWCTRSHNIKHAIDLGLNSSKGETHHNSLLKEPQVHEICKLLQEGLIQARVIAEMFNIDPSHVAKIKSGDLWYHIAKDYTFTAYTNSKLSRESIIEIYLSITKGECTKFLAEKFGISVTTVKRIRDKTSHRKIIEDYLNDHRRHR